MAIAEGHSPQDPQLTFPDSRPSSSDSPIIPLDAVRHFLDQADDLPELLDVQRKVEAGQLFAKRSGLHKAQNELAEAKARIDRRIGQITAAMEKSVGGRPQKNSSHNDKSSKASQIREAGISIPQANRLEKIANIPEDEFERHIAEMKEGGDEITQAGLLRAARRAAPVKKAERAHASDDSEEDEWHTPPHIIECARAVMGSIDLDPASSTVAQETVQAKNYYSKEDNGLEKEWRGNVLLNPPNANDLMVPFIDKLLSSEINQAMVLVNNATETEWGNKLLEAASIVCFLQTKGKDFNQEGSSGGAPLQGQMLVGIGVDVGRFTEKFGDMGAILGRVVREEGA